MSHILCLSEVTNSLLNIWQFKITPCLKDSNAYGNIYFARYFDWQGLCRDKWFCEYICTNMSELEDSLATKSAPFEIVFRFYDSDSNKLLSKGGQKIVLIEQESKELVKFPGDLPDKLRYYADDDIV